jgi:hypothetical protein
VPHLHLFCEGEATESIYFTQWYRLRRRTVRVTIDKYHGDPYSLVTKALEFKTLSEKEAARKRGTAPDQIWCVFDCDEHPRIPDAIAKATFHGIRIAFSNPCIELWFLLHYENQSAELDRFEAQGKAYAHLGGGKRLSPNAVEDLISRYDDAKALAQGLVSQHARNYLPLDSNPSSSIWTLVDEICQLG